MLQMRANLMSDLRLYIQKHKLAQSDAAKRLCIAQSRVSDLVRGKWDKFSPEMLISLEARIGRTVRVEFARNVSLNLHLTSMCFKTAGIFRCQVKQRLLRRFTTKCGRFIRPCASSIQHWQSGISKLLFFPEWHNAVVVLIEKHGEQYEGRNIRYSVS